MNWFSPSQRYFLFTGCTDMRKGFDGLCALVSGGMGRDVLCGDVFIFVNRPRNRVKLLVWDRTGFVVCCKRLEEGTFELPADARTELRWDELVPVLEGISLASVRRRKRFSRAV
jgi:transposase